MAKVRERLIPPSERLQREEERISELNRLNEALSSHESALPIIKRNIANAESLIAIFDELLATTAKLPAFTQGHVQSLRANRVFSDEPGRNVGQTHVGCVKSHAAYLFQTSRAVALTKLNNQREQLQVAERNIEVITEALAALEREAA